MERRDDVCGAISFFVPANEVFVCRGNKYCCVTSAGKGVRMHTHTRAHTHSDTKPLLLGWQVEQSN